ncbi:pachytene checkpoint protein 2 homolog [Diachasma alloeum]|uniref:pachytene checkpoint protein 2 homolog n=1 Tax=Diachasma alloeum TaxID=454923 RepID=UPI0007383B11|nr:pachytene checkpoint protein 2 homolog [Diachasma alloeum]
MPNRAVDVEICQKNASTLQDDRITELVHSELMKLEQVDVDIPISTDDSPIELLRDHVAFISCSFRSNGKDNKDKISISESWPLRYFIYRLALEEAATETMQTDSEELPVASHWILPAKEFNGLWENLCYTSNIKENLLNFIETTMLFSERNINPNIITWNKVVLLHGPPGTGKTSLCKALAHKAAIRLNKYFRRGELVEINSHSLFSKWFSESGKLVMKLFNEMKQLLEDPQALVCILIDEVESLAHARKACTSGTEPSDAIRVVNALLTQLDQMKRYKNVLILTTSNVTEAIDLAFVDRADIKQFIGHPEPKAIYQIYSSCLKELMRANFLESFEIQPWEVYDCIGDVPDPIYECISSNGKTTVNLRNLIYKSVGLSGRALRKVPFLAHALFMDNIETSSFDDFLGAMMMAVEKQKEDELQL